MTAPADSPDDKDKKDAGPAGPSKFSRFGALGASAPPPAPETPAPEPPAPETPAAAHAEAITEETAPPTPNVEAPPPPPEIEKITYDVVIIGSGFSGNAVLANIVRYTEKPMTIAVLSRDEEGTFGPAYSTQRVEHLLNVRAGSMGLFASNFNHFYQWATQHDVPNVTPSAYLPRMVYGQYLQSILDETRQMAEQKNIRIDYIKTEVEDIDTGIGHYLEGFRIATTPAGEVTAKTIVLAIGNTVQGRRDNDDLPGLITKPWLFNFDKLGPEPVPPTPEELAAAAAEAAALAAAEAEAAALAQAKAQKPTILVRLLGKKQPAAAPVAEAAPPPEPEIPPPPPPPAEPWREYHSLAVIGSGLTAADTIVSILVSGWKGKIECFSGSGLLPRAHLEDYDSTQIFKISAQALNSNTLSQNMRLLRRREKTHGVRWQYLVDGLRPVTQAVWQDMDPADKRRLAGKYFTLWNVFRHRFAPQIGRIIEAAIAEKRLVITKARVTGARQAGEQVALDLKARNGEITTRSFDIAFQCTGMNYKTESNPLLKRLTERNILRPDPNGYGILVQSDLAAHRSEAGLIYAMGSPLFGQLFETTAVPELRVQADAIAHYIVQSNH